MFVHFTTINSYCEEPSYEINQEYENQSECIICYEKADELLMLMKNVKVSEQCNCNPIIHRSCYSKWINKSGMCPICRVSVAYEVAIAEYKYKLTSIKVIVYIMAFIIVVYIYEM